MTKTVDHRSTPATLRPVKPLPSSLPNEISASAECEPVSMAQAWLENDTLTFTDRCQWDKVFRDGFFLLQIPEGIDFSAGDRFVEQFYRPSCDDEHDFRKVSFDEQYQGYFDRPHDQWENFYVERSNWYSVPKDVSLLGHQMAELGVTVLRNVLHHLQIPHCFWDQITGDLTSGGGHRMLAFNHFRSEKNTRGCKMHRDSGWVTILRSYEPGLLALVDGKLRSINPVEGHVIVNFGSSIEVLTGTAPKTVRANIHGVAQTMESERKKDRHSYAMFLDSRLDGTIYEMQDNSPRALQSVAEFAEQEVARTYDADNVNV